MCTKQHHRLDSYNKRLILLLLFCNSIILVGCQRKKHVATDSIPEKDTGKSDKEVLDRLETLNARGKKVRFLKNPTNFNKPYWLGYEACVQKEVRIQNSLSTDKILKKLSNRKKELKQEIATINKELETINQETATINQELETINQELETLPIETDK
jgi:DNA repair exonuclease SbcCD ATPase subunit